jgi:hypothetical protein
LRSLLSRLGTIIGAGIDTFWVPQLPERLTVGVAVRLTATAEELASGDPHPIRNVIRSPDGEIQSDLSDDLTVQGQSARPEWLTGIVIATLAVIEAAAEGTHMFEFFVDQSSQAVPLHVIEGLPSAPDA